MATEDLIEIGNMLYERRADGVLYPVRRVRPDTEARGAPAQDPSLLNVGGIGERLAFLNQTFNPIEGVGSSMRAASRMAAPDQSYWDRISALGEMASGVASIAAPLAAAKAIGVPAASVMMEVLLGASPTSQAATDMARGFMADESGALRLFHGSPHDFDRFSMSKIGTGEGAQAYGRGLYFAENPETAEMYRRKLAFPAGGGDDILAQIADDVNYYNGSVDAARAAYEDGLTSSNPAVVAQSRAKLDALPAAEVKYKGRMYEVNVNANPEDFINFDAPFEQQPPNVQKYFGYLARGESKPTGEDLARRMESNIFIQEAAQAGIPGIRYLDEGSRNQAVQPYYNIIRESDNAVVQQRIARDEAPSVGEGFRAEGPIDPRTRNYVVFDDNLISIVRKYGIAGAAAMLGVSAADVEAAIAQGMPPSQWDQLVVGPQ